MKSVRLEAELEGRLEVTARRLGVTESEVIRMAIDEFCDSDAGSTLFERVKGLIEEAESQATGELIDVASRAHKLYGEWLYEDWLNKQELRVAENRTHYNTPKPDPD